MQIIISPAKKMNIDTDSLAPVNDDFERGPVDVTLQRQFPVLAERKNGLEDTKELLARVMG